VVDERGLADARFAADEDEAAASGRGLPQPTIQRLDVSFTLKQVHIPTIAGEPSPSGNLARHPIIVRVHDTCQYRPIRTKESAMVLSPGVTSRRGTSPVVASTDPASVPP
jgi:hypothetical protein